MARPVLTWRDVAAPNFRSAAEMSGKAADLLNQGLGGLGAAFEGLDKQYANEANVDFLRSVAQLQEQGKLGEAIASGSLGSEQASRYLTPENMKYAMDDFRRNNQVFEEARDKHGWLKDARSFMQENPDVYLQAQQAGSKEDWSTANKLMQTAGITPEALDHILGNFSAPTQMQWTQNRVTKNQDARAAASHNANMASTALKQSDEKAIREFFETNKGAEFELMGHINAGDNAKANELLTKLNAPYAVRQQVAAHLSPTTQAQVISNIKALNDLGRKQVTDSLLSTLNTPGMTEANARGYISNNWSSLSPEQQEAIRQNFESRYNKLLFMENTPEERSVGDLLNTSFSNPASQASTTTNPTEGNDYVTPALQSAIEALKAPSILDSITPPEGRQDNVASLVQSAQQANAQTEPEVQETPASTQLRSVSDFSAYDRTHPSSDFSVPNADNTRQVTPQNFTPREQINSVADIANSVDRMLALDSAIDTGQARGFGEPRQRGQR